MVSVKTPYIVKKIYYSLIWDLKNGSKELFLTFDDGPNPNVTPKILDILRQYNAKATFFCIGRNVERFQDLYNQILEEGHKTGNHTYSHLKGWKTKNKEYYNDIELARQTIDSRLFRPPYGKIKRAQLKYLRQNYYIIMWDVISYDYDEKVSIEKCFKNVIENVRPGSIIVFHDSEKAEEKALQTLPLILDHFTKQEYKFNCIEEKLINNCNLTK